MIERRHNVLSFHLYQQSLSIRLQVTYVRSSYPQAQAETQRQMCERNETILMSELCLNNWQNVTYLDSNVTVNCYPNDVDSLITEILALWFLICSTVGIFGNLLTLIALPYAAWKKRYV